MYEKDKKPQGRPPPEPSVDPRLDALIGEKLRSYYDSLLSEPVPDRIVELLGKLEAKEREEQSGSSA